MTKLKILFLVSIVGGLAGCDLLDRPEPTQSLLIDDITDDGDGLRALATGIYDGIQSANIAGGNYNVVPEIMADNVVWTGSFENFARIHALEMIPENPTSAWWGASYVVINMANLIIEEAERIAGEDPEISSVEADFILGDAYFIRGMLYFEMARVFSRPWWHTGDGSHEGVPLRTRSVIDTDQLENLPRNTLAESYERSRADLEEAARRLPDVSIRSSSDVDRHGDKRATRSTALGYLMRLELVKGNYGVAADYAGQIIDSGHFDLTPHPEDPFLVEFSPESIFEVIHTRDDNPGVNAGQNAFYAPREYGGRGDIQISEGFVNAFGSIVTEQQQVAIDAAGFEVEDLRRELLTGLRPGIDATLKFRDGVNNADNVINMRYADILLSRSEALAEEAVGLDDVPQEAFDTLNQVRTRSLNVTDPQTGENHDRLIRFERADFANKQDLINTILRERRVELAFEGDRFHTLHRKGLSIRGIAPNADRILFPLPQGEVDANPEIDQHGGF